MLKIDCPFCGPRDEIEFRCGGQSHITRPGPHSEVSDTAWAQYLYLRGNPKGWHYERWLHASGCRQWFNVVRQTTTHEIKAIYAMGAPRPDVEGGS
ncbi:MAG TPA: sarcosine oxidase subunit delta [Nevskiaceae bacterium]|nr:sarcosine oxidase subunit delta [Nevskiaceae bacterium]